MRCILAPPHHFVVPSPYKQGESAVRINIPHGSCTLYSVLYYLSVVLCALYSCFTLSQSSLQASRATLGGGGNLR